MDENIDGSRPEHRLKAVGGSLDGCIISVPFGRDSIEAEMADHTRHNYSVRDNGDLVVLAYLGRATHL